MKKLTLFGVLGAVAVIGIAIATAGQMGEKAHAFARGKIVLAPELQAKAQGAETLFIIVGYPDRPMPYGAFRKKLQPNPQGTLFEFNLTYDNVQRMLEDQPWPSEFKLKARLDRDGVAGPDQPGDLVGEIAVVKQGENDLELRIDRIIE